MEPSLPNLEIPGGERGRYLALGADLEMDIVTLEQAARDIGLV